MVPTDTAVAPIAKPSAVNIERRLTLRAELMSSSLRVTDLLEFSFCEAMLVFSISIVSMKAAADCQS